MYSEELSKLEKEHGFYLSRWQRAIFDLIYVCPIGCGKSFLIEVLHRIDMNVQGRTDLCNYSGLGSIAIKPGGKYKISKSSQKGSSQNQKPKKEIK